MLQFHLSDQFNKEENDEAVLDIFYKWQEFWQLKVEDNQILIMNDVLVEIDVFDKYRYFSSKLSVEDSSCV